MELNELVEKFKSMPTSRFESIFHEFLRQHPSYGNLNNDNSRLIMDILKKHREHIVRGMGISYDAIRDETHALYEKRLELKLTERDLDHIREILGLFKK